MRDGSGTRAMQRVPLEDRRKWAFAEQDDVVEAFATNGSDQPLGMTVLPGRAWRGHRTYASGVGWTECPVARQPRRFVPRGGFSYLFRDQSVVGLVVTLTVISRFRA